MNRVRLLDYLYGEMTPGEKVDFEKSLANNPALSKEVDELQLVREYLGQSKDQNASPMQMVVNAPRRKLANSWWAVAASLLLLLAAGKILDLRVAIDQQQLMISYGKVERIGSNSAADLQQQYALLEKSLGEIQSQLSVYQSTLDQPIPALSTGQTIDPGHLVKMVGTMVEKEQISSENRLAAKILEDQQIYIQSMAQGLMRYWDEQRKIDLQMVNSGLENLVQAIQMNSRDLTQFVNNTQQNY